MVRWTRRSLVILVVATLFAGRAAAQAPTTDIDGANTPLLLGDRYPLEASASFPGALLHWLDSLANLSGAGFTAGKTIAAHRLTYVEMLGRPTDQAQEWLRVYRDLRVAVVNASDDDRDALTRVFFQAPTLDAALRESGPFFTDRDRASMTEAISHFEGAYRKIWNNGEVPRGFVAESLADRRRKELARFLVAVAGFFQVEPDGPPRPRLILAPVRAGFGTHAQAIDEYLLIEVRPGERLLDQVAPIVHENSHLLFYRMEPERLEALEAVALARGRVGRQAWQNLREALPTAIAQGVAQSKLRPERWSMRASWYHREEIDAYAKAIFPLVKRALAKRRPLDTKLIEEMVEIFAGTADTPTSGRQTTPRSP
jgi:hypothetical protein